MISRRQTVMISTIIIYSLLAALVLIGALISLSLQPRIRGWRNLTMLGCYIVGVVSFFVVDLWIAVAVWVGLGFLSGTAYMIFDYWAARRHPDPDAPPRLDLLHLVYGPITWPLILLEVFEYTWAELFPMENESAPPTASP